MFSTFLVSVFESLLIILAKKLSILKHRIHRNYKHANNLIISVCLCVFVCASEMELLWSGGNAARTGTSKPMDGWM